ncbi:MAG: chemotaxis protein [Bacillota bacterium]
MQEQKGILLESGTGELEILEFTVAGVHYAINVIKVKEILEVDNITKMPNAHPAIAGLTLVRGDVVSLIDMNYVLEKKETAKSEKHKTLLCEFNQLKVAFCVDSVLGIHRIGWNMISKPDSLMQSSLVIGNINLGNKIVMLLDFEKIVMDISPSSGINASRIEHITSRDRSNAKLVLADDSPMIRQVLKDVLIKAGYVDLKFFDDGRQTLEYLKSLADTKGENFMEDVQVLITDIEMPQLDGHTLTRRVKEDKILQKLPVIIFSSLITDELFHKGDSVGADAQMSKPQVGKLVELIDSFIYGK